MDTGIGTSRRGDTNALPGHALQRVFNRRLDGGGIILYLPAAKSTAVIFDNHFKCRYHLPCAFRYQCPYRGNRKPRLKEKDETIVGWNYFFNLPLEYCMNRCCAGIESLIGRVNHDFEKMVKRIYTASGRLIVSGIGKSGIVGRKIVATLNSTGTRSLFLHPVEAMHGDLGQVEPDDIFLALSYSGETDELNILLPEYFATQHPSSRLSDHRFHGPAPRLDPGQSQRYCY